ncbi:signal transducer [Ephemerocybe angulata]|uniref:Signal transducer n=1 Tax=Ephemerocybe angulata TaxID=980116 RepID=A0A8H6H7F4_9AGAR|nr:signal transducer [Tulosesus angulatus]
MAAHLPLREQSHLDLHNGPTDPQAENIGLEDRLCPGCKKSAVNNEQGGLVVAFGQSFFHVDCFKCAKCRNQVTADTNLLLLSDGSPICANCSYSCNVCKQPILDEAIMAGDDSYHAHCFKCKVCKNRIDELVFAKTSNGIYCMKCHNERMIRIRKHTQKKAERERAQGGSGSSKSRERVARDHHRENTNTLPIPSISGKPNYMRSASYDDSSKAPDESNNSSTTQSTDPVTSRQQKRRSINPGFASITPNSTLSPRTETFAAPGYTDSQSSALANQSANPRRTSHANSEHSVHSLSSNLNDLDTSRSPSPSITKQDYDQQDQTIVLSLPTSVPNPGGPHGERMSAGLSPVDPKATFRSQQRSSTHSNFSLDTRLSGSRSASPAYRADVPHSVESGTDTEPETDGNPGAPSHRNSLPPAPPPKDPVSLSRSPSIQRSGQPGEADESDGESSQPVERAQTSTFIAPALPPIRFSLNPVEFSDLLNSVNTPMTDLANQQKRALEASSPSALHSSSYFSMSDDSSSQPPTPTAESSNGHTSSGHSEGSYSNQNGVYEPKSSQSSARTHITITPANAIPRTRSPDVVTARLREAVDDAKDRNAQQLKVDRAFLEAILETWDSRSAEFNQMRTKLDGMRRASKQYIEGLTVAQTEYDKELKARRDAEAEVTRLRVLLSGQAARLTALSGDSKRQEVRQQMSKEINDNLSGLEEEMSRLRAERDMTLAEMEELSASKSSGSAEVVPATLGRSLTKRLDNIRSQYSRDLIPLQKQREQLQREIVELRAVRDVFLEETASLNARNEELAALSAQYSRRIDTIPETPMRNGDTQRAPVIDKNRQLSTPGPLLAPSLSTSTSSSSTIYEDNSDNRHMKVPGINTEMHTPSKNKFKWPGSKVKDMVSPPATSGVEFSKGKAHIEHNFQQLSVLRFTRCDHCGDKMWGSQLKCTVCSTSIHVRCIANVQIPCSHQGLVKEDGPSEPLPPSMFGRELIEQVQADSKDGERHIPVIVEKCIDAVDALALDYEGIYRKTGGSTQTRGITQLFERGDYASFDLLDTDRFNDICSVTSVLKTYFRSLPVPLLTFDLHDQIIAAVSIKDQVSKDKTLTDLVNNLPDEHYYTLRKLMIHLHHVRLQCEKNRMTSRNLGVVFGPTLMRSRDPGAEFSDMAGKALFIEWLIDNAPEVFKDDS